MVASRGTDIVRVPVREATARARTVGARLYEDIGLLRLSPPGRALPAESPPAGRAPDTLPPVGGSGAVYSQVVVTSHQAYYTVDAVNEIVATTVQNITDYAAGRRSENVLVPPPGDLIAG